jgi:hypothetical protein
VLYGYLLASIDGKSVIWFVLAEKLKVFLEKKAEKKLNFLAF